MTIGDVEFKKNHHRKDIDGIRALAIIPVMINHAWPSALSGGYLGVDIFFVLSGYLITAGAMKSTQEGKFSLGLFWWRRACRILPAFLVVMIVTAILSPFFLTGVETIIAGKTALASFVFSSNLYIPRLNWGYFAPSASLNPFIHTWSLGVEEQFYLIFPFLFALLYKKAGLMKSLFAVAFLLSFVFSMLADPLNVWTHYNPLLRAWEILAGSLLAIHEYEKKISNISIQKQSKLYTIIIKNAGAFGLIALMCAFILASKGVNWGQVLAVAGAVLLLRSEGSGVSGKILKWRPMIIIGLASYSLYLWHQPIMAFSRILIHDSSWAFVTITATISFFLAMATRHLVEIPGINAGKNGSPRKKRIFGAIMLLLWISGSLITFGTLMKGIIKNKQEIILMKEFNIEDGSGKWARICAGDRKSKDFCILPANSNKENVKTVAFWGDSHVMALMIDLQDRDLPFRSIHLAMAGCAISIDPDFARKDLNCLERHRKAWKVIVENPSIKTVVIGLNWSMPDYKRKISQEHKNHIKDVIKDLVLRGKKVILLGAIPWQEIDPIRKFKIFGESSETKTKKSRSFNVFEEPRSIAKDLEKNDVKIDFIEPKDILCDDDYCIGSVNGIPIYFDSSHINRTGSKMLLDRLVLPAILDSLGEHSPD